MRDVDLIEFDAHVGRSVDRQIAVDVDMASFRTREPEVMHARTCPAPVDDRFAIGAPDYRVEADGHVSKLEFVALER